MNKQNSVVSEKGAFPYKYFLIYVLFYSGQSIYNTYLNLYMTDLGFTKTMIGSILSVSTLFMLAAQLFWGFASDRVRYKNTIIIILFFAGALTSLLFYLSASYYYLMGIISLFLVFFTPIVPLLDNLTMESIESSKWDFGHIRIGGTLGYAGTVLVTGYLLKDNYSPMFWLIGLIMTLCLFTILSFPKVKGADKSTDKKERTPLRLIFQNKMMVALLLFNLVASLGASFYHSFYPIYFTSIGGKSVHVGIMMFVSAMSEIPILIYISRLIKKHGVEKVILVSGIFAGIRWILLYLLKNPILIILTGLFNGFSFIGISFCMTLYVNQAVPVSLRATSHSVFAFIGTFFSRVIFGYLGGLISDIFGVNSVMLVTGIITFLSVIVFVFWLKKNKDDQGESPELQAT